MQRSNILGVSALAAGLAMLPGGASAQQKPIKDLIVGTWTLLIDDGVKEDGAHAPNFGPNPEGQLIFTADGHYSLQIFRSGRPAFASKNRLTGTADENKAAVQGAVAYFGTYSTDEATKTLTLRVAASSFPNQEGTSQKRVITAITNDVLTYNNPTPAPASGNVRGEVAWKKAK